MVTWLAQIAPHTSSTTFGDWVVGGGGLAMALALLRVGWVTGKIGQILADHERRMTKNEGETLDNRDDIRDLQASWTASGPRLRPRRGRNKS